MGNPGNLFDNLDSNPDTLLIWQSFVADLASHYIGKVSVETLFFLMSGLFFVRNIMYIPTKNTVWPKENGHFLKEHISKGNVVYNYHFLG